MATSEENENNLHYCRIKRDNCAGQTGDSELSSDEHVKNRGYALSYIIAIQHEIYRLRPELTSDYHRDKSVDGDVSKVTENREATFAWK